MAATIIEARELTKIFPDGTMAVDSLDLRVRAGSIYGLVGPNGAGKTTALRLLMGLLRPQSGVARIWGEDMGSAPRALRSRVAYVPQALQAHGWMTLEESCRYASRMFESWDHEYAQVLASRWELAWKRQIGRMSGGDQRKTTLLMALASRPRVLLLDEPAAGLDPIVRRAVIDEIIEAVGHGEGCTVLISTHLLEDLERVVDHIGFMDAGRMVLSSRLDDLQNTIKRVQVVFSTDRPPDHFSIPGALWTERSGSVVTALAQLVSEVQLDSIRYLPEVRVQVFPLNLQEIFLALFGQPQRRRAETENLDQAPSRIKPILTEF